MTYHIPDLSDRIKAIARLYFSDVAHFLHSTRKGYFTLMSDTVVDPTAEVQEEHGDDLSVVYISLVLQKLEATADSSKSRASVGRTRATTALESGDYTKLGYALYDTDTGSLRVGSVGLKEDEFECVVEREIAGKALGGKRLAGVVCMRDQADFIRVPLRPFLIKSAPRDTSEPPALGDADADASKPHKSTSSDRGAHHGSGAAYLDTVPASKGRAADNAGEILNTMFTNIIEILGQSPTRQEYRMAVAAAIDFADASQVVSAGILLSHLKKLRVIGGRFNRAPSSVEPGDGRAQGLCAVASIGQLLLKNYAYIDQATLHSLQVFSSDAHPSQVRGRGRTKEGLSMLAFFERNLSRLSSRQRLREMLRQPSSRLETIQIRLNAVEQIFTSQQNHPEALSRLRQLLRPTTQLGSVVARFRRFSNSTSDWGSLHRALASLPSVLDSLKSLVNNDTSPEEVLPIGPSYLATVVSDLVDCHESFDLLRRLAESIDWERSCQSSSANNVIVQPGISEKLDELRTLQDEMPQDLEAAANTIRLAIPSLGHFEVEAMPQFGCLVSLPRTSMPASDAAQDALGSLSFVLEDTSTVYFRHASTEAIDAKYGDIHQLLQAEEAVVLRDLRELVQATAEDMMFVDSILADLDVIMCFAAVSADFEFVRPTLDASTTTRIRGCRHPILDYLHETSIPNDAMLGADEPSVAVITGPNASGKSVYIKSVVLTQYLAQIGCFVPAVEAHLGIASSFMVCIGPTDSATSGLSSFQHELVDVARALALCDSRAIVAIDEFGRGTNSTDGAALFGALVRHLALKKSGVRALLATHFTEAVSTNVLGIPVKFSEPVEGSLGSQSAQPDATEGPSRDTGVACFRMDVRFADENEPSIGSKRIQRGAEAEVEPMFKLIRGTSDGSFGVQCALAAGVPQGVCARAAAAIQQIRESRSNSPRLGSGAHAVDAYYSQFRAFAWLH